MIERLSERITIQRCEAAMDSIGNHVNSWADHFSCGAHVSTYNREETGNPVPEDQRSVTFEVRYCSELAGVTSTGYRILFRDAVYNIQSVDLMNYQKKIIRLHCLKEVRP